MSLRALRTPDDRPFGQKIRTVRRDGVRFPPAVAEPVSRDRRILLELWAEGAKHRLATLHRDPPVIGELIPHAGASWRVLRIEEARPSAFRPLRAIVERAPIERRPAG
jgi:hypothetical protein